MRTFSFLLFAFPLPSIKFYSLTTLIVLQLLKKSNVDIVAEYIIKITWPTDSPDDIDLWMRDPLGNFVGFKSKDVGLMSLNRDDLGTSNDTVYDPKGKPIPYSAF